MSAIAGAMPTAPAALALPDGLPPARRLRAVSAVMVAVGMATLDNAIANTALPTIARDLGTTPAASVWVITSYQLGMVATLLALASAGEIVGHRKIAIGGLILFTASSLVCALAWSLPSLTLARAVQGLGASGIMAVNTALIRFIYPARQMGRGMGLNALIVAVGFALGPTVAAMILAVAPSWTWLFAINVPFGLLALALAWTSLPDTPSVGRRFDIVGATLNAGAFGFLILSLGEAGHRAPIWESLAGFAVSGLFWLIMLRRQGRRGRDAPIFPTDLFRQRIFALSVATACCAFAAQGFAFVSLPFLFQEQLGRTPVQTGFLLTPWPVMVAIMGIVAGRLSDRYPAGVLGGAGLALLAVGMASLVVLPADPGAADLGWRLVICGIGFGLFQSPNMRALMASAPPTRSGGASGMVASARLTGQSTGAALVALCFALSATDGEQLALGLGAAFAALGCMLSLARMVRA